jgi:hypothetical protein
VRSLALAAPLLLLAGLVGTACDTSYVWSGYVRFDQTDADDPSVEINNRTIYYVYTADPHQVDQTIFVKEHIANPTPCEPPNTHLVSITKIGRQEFQPATISITDPSTGAETITVNVATTEPTPIHTRVETNCGSAVDRSGERWGGAVFTFDNPGAGKRSQGSKVIRSNDLDGPLTVRWVLTSSKA